MATVTRRELLALGAAALAGCSRPRATEIAGGWIDTGAMRGHAWRDGRLPRADAGVPSGRCSVAIVGGGIAGLATARALRLAGIDDLRVFELDDVAGGNARGHVMGGMACPLGAHYLPVPGTPAREVAEWLHEIGLARQELGRTVYEERHLCHAPQERIFVAAVNEGSAAGRWHEGLVPLEGASEATLAQWRRFAAELRDLQAALGFAMPTLRAPWHAGLAALDAEPFSSWLDTHGYDDPLLRAHLDYCCRDDYGAGLGLVSAWAGIHYFASRHGFAAPGEREEPQDPVLTWPEGNAWLSTRLAADVGDRLLCGRVATRVAVGAPGRPHAIDVWDARTDRPERWLADRVVLAVPLFVAQRLLDAPPAALTAVVPAMLHAPWLVSNIQLDQPLFDRPGPAPAWDNVIAGSAALGYVDAMHQRLSPVPGPTVMTHYWALGGQSAVELKAARARLLTTPWTHWRDAVLADLARAHPDLAAKTVRIDAMRYGHAMCVPTPGLRGSAALAALAEPHGALHFAHADLSASSSFEEAFTRGTLAGRAAAAALHGAPRAQS